MAILLSILFVLTCLLLIFMVVVTPSQSEGLASAFGGMGSDSFFGTKAHSHINKFTIVLAVAFIVLAIGINLAQKGTVAPGAGSNSLLNTGGNPAPTESTSPSPSPSK